MAKRSSRKRKAGTRRNKHLVKIAITKSEIARLHNVIANPKRKRISKRKRAFRRKSRRLFKARK